MQNKLKKYNSKRDFNKTREPVGKMEVTNKKLRFCVQHHLARKDHYDFRLEWDGTLKSWAVPKGPSYNPKDKRLAVQVEDHPISYKNFEGTIPKGEYGGGTVMLWDEGYWEPLESVQTGLKNGSLKFILKGSRLKGKWTLIHFKEKNWLLIKEIDDVIGYSDINEYNTSIKTGRTMNEIENNIEKKKNVIESILISNPDKLLFKKEKITKLDLASYYEKVADRMLPFLENRLISVIRCPEGIDGECFFKKHLEAKNKGLCKVRVPSQKGKKEDYYYIKDKVGLINEVQMNSVEFHVWGSRASSINRPDMMVFDLDPDENLSLSKVREGVRNLKSILDDLGLVSFLKTSGGKGYHIVVPMTSIKNWQEFREVSRNIAKLMEVKWPDKYVSNMRMKNRKNKIFIDWIRNTKKATSVAPYSVRARNGAKVSMPIFWKELDKIKPDGITMDLAIKRLKRKDPWEDFFKIEQ